MTCEKNVAGHPIHRRVVNVVVVARCGVYCIDDFGVGGIDDFGVLLCVCVLFIGGVLRGGVSCHKFFIAAMAAREAPRMMTRMASYPIRWSLQNKP